MILLRGASDDEGTAGYLVWGNDYIHTIELPWRNNQQNYSAIPAGKYSLRMRISPKYGRCYEVVDVPNRNHILLHHGNLAGDRLLGYKTHSAGCILLGSRPGRLSSQKAVLASKIARRKFETAMNWEPQVLEIINV